MSEIKYFLERKRDGPVGWLLGGGDARGHLINFIFLISNNIKIDGRRQPNIFRRGAVVGRARPHGVARSA